MSEDTVNIEIDGRALEARKGAMIIEVSDRAGITVPRFCYHHKLAVAANCRMCLVEVEKAPKPLPACATPVTEGMKIRTRSPLALRAQKSVMEFLLINHPLDCPICDQGGECELQDLAMGYGKGVSRFNERKRVVPDQDLGPLIATDMTRCIHCTRCVRFGEEIAGLPELGATGRGENVRIGTFVERSVTSELSGNVIDLCPVGALTSKPFRFRARAWEMQQRASVAPHDGIGSNVDLHIARGRVLRVVPRENEPVNEVWLSDRDRFSYEGLYAPDRLLAPMLRGDDGWRECDWETALGAVADGLRAARGRDGGTAVGALASPSSTTEELYLLQKILRGLGSNNLDHRLRTADLRDQDAAPLYPSLGVDIAGLENARCVLLVGSNTRKDYPLLNHRIRKAVRRGASVFAINPVNWDFNYPLAGKLVVPPAAMAGALAALAKAVATAAGAPVTADERVQKASPGDAERALAGALVAAGKPVVLCGAAVEMHPDGSLLRALAGTIAKVSGGAFGFLPDGANTAGACLAGFLPHRGPGGGAPDGAAGKDARAMLSGGLSAAVLLGLEPEHDCLEGQDAVTALSGTGFVAALTAYRTEAIESYASVMLPIAPYAETEGTRVNLDGCWQSAPAAVKPAGDSRPAWRILRVLGNLLDLDGFDYVHCEQVLAECRERLGAEARPHNEVAWRAPDSERMSGDGLVRIAEPRAYALDAVVRRAGALQRSFDGARPALALNPLLAQRLKVGEGEELRIKQGGGECVLPVALDERVPDGCLYVQSGMAVAAALGAAHAPVSVEKA